MVVMIVADDDEVDARQILEADAGGAHPANADEGERRGIVRPDRVGQDVDAVDLHQHGRVADPGDPHLRTGDGGRRHGRGNRRAFRPMPALAAQPAVEEATRIEPGRLAHAGIEEAVAVKMVADRPGIIDPVEEGRHQSRREAEGDQHEQHDRAQPFQQWPDHLWAARTRLQTAGSGGAAGLPVVAPPSAGTRVKPVGACCSS